MVRHGRDRCSEFDGVNGLRDMRLESRRENPSPIFGARVARQRDRGEKTIGDIRAFPTLTEGPLYDPGALNSPSQTKKVVDGIATTGKPVVGFGMTRGDIRRVDQCSRNARYATLGPEFAPSHSADCRGHGLGSNRSAGAGRAFRPGADARSGTIGNQSDRIAISGRAVDVRFGYWLTMFASSCYNASQSYSVPTQDRG